jgi:hypothetical protein
MAKNKQNTDNSSQAEGVGVDRSTAKPHISSKSISEIIDEVSRRHRKSLDRLAE